MSLSSTTTIPNRIAFGSCNNQDLQNTLWPIIESREPAAFVWGGDAIYADIELPSDYSTIPPKSQELCATPQRLKYLYQRQLQDTGYRRLLEKNVSIFGTFDDHDYGCNNADGTFEYKYESAMLYVDFLGPSASPAMKQRARAGQGVYGVQLFDFDRPAGAYQVPEDEAAIDPDLAVTELLPVVPTYSNKSVAVFVLDIRSHKTPWKDGSAAYQPDYDGDFLGERQWQWFETALRRSRAAVNVVVSGLQVHANIFPDGNIAEAWERYPRAQQRLFEALLQPGVEAPLLISGDVHMTQLMRKDCVRRTTRGRSDHNNKHTDEAAYDVRSRRSLVEMTTSGMTHSWGTINSPPKNQLNKRPTWAERYQSFAARTLMHSLHQFCPWTSLMYANRAGIATNSNAQTWESGGGEQAHGGLQYSLQKNFGELEFDWDARTVTLRTLGNTVHAAPLLSAKLSMDQLSGRRLVPNGRATLNDFAAVDRMHDQQLPDREWICVNYRGFDNRIMHMVGHLSTAVVLVALLPVPLLLPAVALLFRRRRRRRSHSHRTMHMSVSSSSSSFKSIA